MNFIVAVLDSDIKLLEPQGNGEERERQRDNICVHVVDVVL